MYPCVLMGLAVMLYYSHSDDFWSSELFGRRFFFFFSKNDCILSWNLAVPQNISSYSVYYYTVPWSFCNCSVMLCFWVMFGVECDVLAGFKIATQLSVLPGHKMYSKQHLNLMRMREICDKSIYRALSENLFILKIY